MPLRTFTDHDGHTWKVWTVVPTLARNDRKLHLGTGMVDGWLCFESGEVKRRIIPAPPGWEAWSAERLDAALAEAQPVERRAVPRLEGESASV